MAGLWRRASLARWTGWLAAIALCWGCAVTRVHPSPSTASAAGGPAASAPADSSPFAPDPIVDPGATVRLAQTMEALTPRWGNSPDGPVLFDDFGENPIVLDGGTKVEIRGDQRPGSDGSWVLVWIAPNDHSWPNDFGGWLPATLHGRQTLRPIPSEACPAQVTIGAVAALLAPDRRRCLGGAEVTLEAKTWYPGLNVAYLADPRWIGGLAGNAGPAHSVSLFDGGPDPFGRGAPIGPLSGVAFIDARVPPDVGVPPLGMVVRVTGRFDHPAVAACTRAYPGLGPGAAHKDGWGLPPESPADSVEWCRNQFVVTGWEVALGPEGRPIDLARPQLHRVPDAMLGPGGGIACGGVGMPFLKFRIDLGRIDPVWIEVLGGGTSVARFSPGFGIVPGELPGDIPRVVAANGVTLVDGEVLDPDRGKPGLGVCPEGEVIDFQVAEP